MWINSYSFVVGNLSERGFDAGFRREKVGAGRKEYDVEMRFVQARRSARSSRFLRFSAIFVQC